MSNNCKFPKQCILRKKLDFKILLEKGKTINVFPFYIKYKIIDNNSISNVKAAFSVKKRDFKKATKRNYLKRIIKEAYRKNKHLLEDVFISKKILILIVYNSKSILNYSKIELALIELLHNLSQKNK
jgi:ribonuclease P protein component